MALSPLDSCAQVNEAFLDCRSLNMSKPYLGLRGNKLTWTMILTIVFPAYFMAGYNNAVPGGLLSLDSFVETFPTIDTIHTTGAAQQHAATIQGE